MGELGSDTEPLLLDVDRASHAREAQLAAGPLPCSEIVEIAAWESKNLWCLSWASIIISVFNFTLSLVTQMFVGHLGSLVLAGVSIANVGIQGLAYGVMVPTRPSFLPSFSFVTFVLL